MNTLDMTSTLGFGTLIVGLLIAVVIWVRFMRKPENRHPMRGQEERNIGEIREDAERNMPHPDTQRHQHRDL